MGTGLISGMGYLGFASLFTLIMCAMFILYNLLAGGYAVKMAASKTINVTIPEDLDYTDIFDDIFKKYARSHQLVMVKSINLGSMFRLTYNLTLRDAKQEKEFIDAIRTRNGNLSVLCAVPLSQENERL
jgi:hypothetical protein